ncbi:putative antitoxin [Mycobacterium tuberculosis HKBS1]|nr:putative antitoxin [Mycobacterium tuberculosis HKBS1]
MALSIKHPEADRLARALAARTGETLTEAVVTALRERLARETGRARVDRCATSLPRFGTGAQRCRWSTTGPLRRFSAMTSADCRPDGDRHVRARCDAQRRARRRAVRGRRRSRPHPADVDGVLPGNGTRDRSPLR